MNKTSSSSSAISSDHAAGLGSKSSSTLAPQKEVIYTPALEVLIQKRIQLSSLSFQKSQQRLQYCKRLREDDAQQLVQDEFLYDLYEHTSNMTLNLSQFGDDRPLTSVRYSADGQFVASGSFCSAIKVWDASALNNTATLRGHYDRVTSVAWSQTSGPSGQSLLASTSADGHCIIWGDSFMGSSSAMDNGQSQAQPFLHRVQISSSIVSSCDFHPYQGVIGVSCHDFSWRLIDIETGVELLLQDGHVKECSSICFHPDGSLVMTTDAGGVALLWDLRSGQMIQGFQGHIKKISGSCFSANGYQVASCSLDDTVKIWDLRKRKCYYTLPAHTNVLSDVRYSRSGELLLTSSFDGTLKVWSSRDFHILRTLSGHLGKVMSCDYAPDEKHIVSAGYDKTIKLWAHKDEF